MLRLLGAVFVCLCICILFVLVFVFVTVFANLEEELIDVASGGLSKTPGEEHRTVCLRRTLQAFWGGGLGWIGLIL